MDVVFHQGVRNPYERPSFIRRSNLMNINAERHQAELRAATSELPR